MENQINKQKKNKKSFVILDQKGQSFIEFVLLMLIVVGLSYGYMKIVNGNLAKRWEKMVNVVINDGRVFNRSTVSLP